MGHKIFVSYKFMDDNVYPLKPYGKTTVRSYVDKLEDYFDATSHIYKGESDNEDLSYLSDEAIWSKLKDRIFNSSVTIVMISPNMKEPHKLDRSQWIPWEISYSLKEMIRSDRISRSNAILAVVLPDMNNRYDYFWVDNQCGYCNCITYLTNTLFDILSSNMFNQKVKKEFDCSTNIKKDVFSGEYSYIKSVKWDTFIGSVDSFIDKVVAIKGNIENYKITKDI